MLDGKVEIFARVVAERNPNLVSHPYQWAAATSLAYNIGGSKYIHSTVANEFAAGHFRLACNHFTDWKYAGGRINPGLLKRRQTERDLCLRGL